MSDDTTAAGSTQRKLECPSAQPGMENARPIGVIAGSATETRIAFFKKETLDQFDWRSRFADAEATRLLRFGATCDESRCAHFSSGRCSLGKRVNDQLAAVVDDLPPCLLRSTCRWFSEQGRSVCLRCPQVITKIPRAEDALNAVATARGSQD
jgi:hypothetical protein